ncbi:MAG TPA: hypothetical protein VJ010_01635, partial [Actinomycetota bacterium]|nr:hypothetical protein [Actinomycetota bacterium]
LLDPTAILIEIRADPIPRRLPVLVLTEPNDHDQHGMGAAAVDDERRLSPEPPNNDPGACPICRFEQPQWATDRQP